MGINDLGLIEINRYSRELRDALLSRQIPVSEIPAANETLLNLRRRKIELTGQDPEHVSYGFEEKRLMVDLEERVESGDPHAVDIMKRYNQKIEADLEAPS